MLHLFSISGPVNCSCTAFIHQTHTAAAFPRSHASSSCSCIRDADSISKALKLPSPRIAANTNAYVAATYCYGAPAIHCSWAAATYLVPPAPQPLARPPYWFSPFCWPPARPSKGFHLLLPATFPSPRVNLYSALLPVLYPGFCVASVPPPGNHLACILSVPCPQAIHMSSPTSPLLSHPPKIVDRGFCW